MLTRVVLDPGVLIAALLSRDGTPAQLVLRWLAGDFELAASPQLLGELSRVLARPKFRTWVTAEESRRYVETVARGVTLYKDSGQTGFVLADPGDDYLVALARIARAHALVSGDAHLLSLRNAEPPVLSPREFLDNLG